MTPLQLFLQQLANGLTLGAIYALIALGYTMVYGVIQLINFAHGEIFIVGAYLALTVILAMGGLPWWAVLPAAAIGAMAGCGLLGWAVERAAYRRIRAAPRLNALITAIGLSFALQNVLMLVYGATDRQFPPVIPLTRWDLGGITVTSIQAVIWAGSGVMMLILRHVVLKTKLGTAMRATSQDLTACALLGIPVNPVIAVTFVFGSVFAAAGGMLFGLYYGTINFHDGYLMGMKAFTAAVLGGIGNIPGALLGGVLLGLCEGLAAGYLSAQWKNVFAFAILVAFLMFKPTGLLGERVSDRA